MRHGVFGKQLSRSKNERRRLRENLLRDLFKRGSIVTTKAKAQSVRGLAEKLITKAKIGSEQKKREVLAVLTDKESVAVLWERARVQFKERTSGFTRVSIMGQRRGDAATAVTLSFVDAEVKKVENAEPKEAVKKTEVKKSEKTTKTKVVKSVKTKNFTKSAKK